MDVTVAVFVIVARQLVSVTVARQLVSVATPIHSVCVARHRVTGEAQDVIVMIAAVLDEAKVGISAALVDVDEEDKTELVTVEVPPLLNLYKSKRELPPQISVLFKEQGILQSVVGKLFGFKVLPQ